MKKVLKKVCSLFLAAVVAVTGIPSVTSAADGAKYADGLYQINGRFTKAEDPGKASMADAAVEKPMNILIEEGQAYLRLRFKTIEYLGQTGYLGEFNYLPDATDVNRIPDETDTVYGSYVEKYYEGFDSYNDPVTGTDAHMKGTKYPYQVTIPVDMDDSEIWIQVYVPVMEEILAGGGYQYSRLQLDWSPESFIQIRDESIQIADLQEKLDQANGMKQGEASKETWEELQQTIKTAQSVLDNLSSTQEQINEQTQKLIDAIAKVNDENKVQADKKELQTLIEKAEAEMKKSGVYTVESLKALEKEVTAAKTVMKDEKAGQTEVNAAKKSLQKAYDSLVTLVDKTALKNKLQEADKALNGGNAYTKESTDALKAAMKTAQSVLDNETATQEETDAQVSALDHAIKGLKKPEVPTPTPDPEPAPDPTPAPDTNEVLDINNLEDGTYVVNGNMVKTDKSSASMSDKAINHNIKITVKDGVYYITMSFKGMTVGGQLGYLGNIQYFESGYSIGSYGKPQGSLGEVTVDAYHEGTQYPKDVTFPMIQEAKADGYIPLQVFVPIMEEIGGEGSGAGTQSVFLKLDYNTLKKVAAGDSSAFEDTNSDDNGAGVPSGKPDANGKPAPSQKGPGVKGPGVNGPKTGDMSHTGAYAVLVGVSAISICLLFEKKRRTNMK